MDQNLLVNGVTCVKAKRIGRDDSKIRVMLLYKFVVFSKPPFRN